jgi:hypothetical protein
MSNFSKASSVLWSTAKFSNVGGWVGGEGLALAKACFRSIVFLFCGGEISPLGDKKKMAVRILCYLKKLLQSRHIWRNMIQ